MSVSMSTADLGKLVVQKATKNGNLQLYEKIVHAPGHYTTGKTGYVNQYKILTSLKDGKPLKRVTVGEELLSHSWGYNKDDTEKNIFGCESIPEFVRSLWKQLYKERGWISTYGCLKSDAIPRSSRKIVSENFETGEKATAAYAYTAYAPGLLSGLPSGYMDLHSRVKEKGGKIIEEYGRLFTARYNRVGCPERAYRISERTYKKDMESSVGEVILSTGYSKTKQRQAVKKGIDVVETKLPVDEYDITRHYLNYDV